MFKLIALAFVSCSTPVPCGNADTICAATEACIAPPVENCLPVCLVDGRALSFGSCDANDASSCGPDWFCTTDGECVTTPLSDACVAVDADAGVQ